MSPLALIPAFVWCVAYVVVISLGVAMWWAFLIATLVALVVLCLW